MLKIDTNNINISKKAKQTTSRPVTSNSTKMKIQNIINVNIPVTDLPWLCGMDHYNNWNKSICRIWKQLYNNDYNEIEKLVRNSGNYCSMDSNTTKIKLLQKKTGSNINISKSVNKINNKNNKDSSSLVSDQFNIQKDILKCNKMSDTEKKQMIKLMNSATNTVYGIKNEARGLNAFINITGKTIKNTQNKMTYTFAEDNLINNTKIIWNVCGKFDGLTTNNEIVEIKNRQRKLFNEIRDYEMCQIQTYLHLNNSETAYLVEVLGGKNDNEINILETKKNVNYIDHIIVPYLVKVREFCLNIPYMNIDDKCKIMSGTSTNLINN
jgi:hypothetical protein